MSNMSRLETWDDPRISGSWDGVTTDARCTRVFV